VNTKEICNKTYKYYISLIKDLEFKETLLELSTWEKNGCLNGQKRTKNFGLKNFP
jgi:hypothetical protein